MSVQDESDPAKLCTFFDSYPEDEELFNIDEHDFHGSELSQF